LGAEALRAIQVSKLRALLRHAAAQSRFYAQRLAEAGVHSDGISDLAELERVPTIDKRQLRRHMAQIVWEGVAGGVRRASTGGSTGQTLTFAMDARREACDQAARARSRGWFGLEVGHRELYLWGAPAEAAARDRLRAMRDWLFNQKLLNAFAMSGERMDRYLEAMEAFGPASVFGYPSSLALLARHARRRGRRLRLPRLQAVFVTGEVLVAADRRMIAETLGAPVVDGYGGRETGFVAHECPEGGMHVAAEHVIVELVDEAGRAVGPGREGQIVVTQLENYAMPLIRYVTGDVGVWEGQDCGCGRSLPVLREVRGRQTDFVVTPDGTVRHALSLIYALRDLDIMEQFRIVQDREYGVTVEVVPANGWGAEMAGVVEGRVRQYLQAEVPIRVAAVPSRWTSATASGKHRYVVSEAPLPEGLGADNR
jgi:phenylacetate-CoA ligase